MARRRAAGACALPIAALALGCATPGGIVDPCRGRHGPGTGPVQEVLELDAWQRTDLPGVTVFSVAGAAETERALRDLQAFVRLVSVLVFREPFSPRAPVRVHLFRHREQFEHFAGCGVAGHAVPGDDGLRVGLDAYLEATDVLQHELVHVLLQNRTGGAYPPWFHEGLAQLLGSAVIRSDVATVGSRPSRSYVFATLEPFPLDRLLALGSAFRSDPEDTLRFYLESWAFVHYGLLSHGMGGARRAPAFLAFVEALRSGESWRPALERSFGMPLEAIAAEYAAHRRRLFRGPTHPVAHIHIGPTVLDVRFEPVSSEVMGRELGRYALEVDRPALAAVLFDHRLGEDPSDAAALLGRIRAAASRGEFALADALWARLPAAERDTLAGWQAAAALAEARYAALGERERLAEGAPLLARARAGYERVLREDPGRASALAGLGRTYVLEPGAAEATRGIEVLERAVRASPHAAPLRVDLGELLLRAGEPARARPHLRYVVEAFPGTDSARRARALLEEAGDRASRAPYSAGSASRASATSRAARRSAALSGRTL